MEHEANRLWINSDSSYNFHEAWLRENFRKNERSQFITVRSDNVLEPAVISRVSLTVGLNQGFILFLPMCSNVKNFSPDTNVWVSLILCIGGVKLNCRTVYS